MSILHSQNDNFTPPLPPSNSVKLSENACINSDKNSEQSARSAMERQRLMAILARRRFAVVGMAVLEESRWKPTVPRVKLERRSWLGHLCREGPKTFRKM